MTTKEITKDEHLGRQCAVTVSEFIHLVGTFVCFPLAAYKKAQIGHKDYNYLPSSLHTRGDMHPA